MQNNEQKENRLIQCVYCNGKVQKDGELEGYTEKIWVQRLFEGNFQTFQRNVNLTRWSEGMTVTVRMTIKWLKTA